MFRDKLRAAAQRNRSWLCVGLDPDAALAPPHIVSESDWVLRLNRGIIEATADLVCAFKPNLAFYEALGADGWQALRATLAAVPPDIPVIGDAKRGDMGNTARAYARALFEELALDAATVNPYLGHDSIAPFLAYRDRGVLLLCRTSNPGSADFQDLACRFDGGEMPLYQVVARRAQAWSAEGCLGLVVGATYPREVAAVRAIAPELPFLLPGVGTQGGDLEAAVRAGVDGAREQAIVNVSRQVMYASAERDWQQAARQAAILFRGRIEAARGAA